VTPREFDLAWRARRAWYRWMYRIGGRTVYAYCLSPVASPLNFAFAPVEVKRCDQ
jgi:hypothetical protein